ncbi:MAG TPA: hypothetical protein VL503_04020 [Candidatus Omnitrophota bacterium]|nr:hypothetical protein [Candidatus Omnitrophota bacterium]
MTKQTLRILALPAAVLLLALVLALLAMPAWAVTITGHVLKGAERAPVKGAPVSIHVVRGNEELPGGTVPSDPEGGFRFTGITDGAGLEYYLSTEYEGAFYTEGPLAIQNGAASQDMQVYDVGKDFAAVKVQDHHVIVERKDDGLHVTEILIFQNDANTAYLGVGANHAMPSGMTVGLPASIKDFKPGLGLDEPSVHVQGREMMSMRPIPPGQRPLSFTYTIPLSGRMDLSHRLYFPTRQMTVLLDDPKLHVESTQLTANGTRAQGGKTYAMYIGSELPVGAEVSMRVGGAGFFSNPKVYPFLAAPFVIAAALWFASRRGSRHMKEKHMAAQASGHPAAVAPSGSTARVQGSPAAARTGAVVAGESAATGISPAKSRHSPSTNGGNGNEMADTYLYLIAALDQGVERGDVSPESHALIRGNLKRRLETILADEPHAKAR